MTADQAARRRRRRKKTQRKEKQKQWAKQPWLLMRVQ